MKYLFFFSMLALSIGAHAFESYSGYIQNQGGLKILKKDNLKFTLTAESAEIKTQIDKLKTNDFISGIGIANTNQVLNVQSIDFIGLGQFVGLWLSPMGLFNVANFTDLQIYVPQKDMSLKNPKANMNYSITPGSGNSWVLFLSDEKQIYYSNLYMNERKAVIRFYSTETGAFLSEISMNKLNQ
ncbi:MAG: hypothetical protein L6Q37_05255 [Bdellovibrionaceae bacterium]|nr:hypothetical protein [Bacteriovoracaceae bacterium]MCK6597751.1 hypothetical protein [Pseudobdellovibrionaceae bacterium]NUM58688.1 hypothetical protein [Pseudobdellovibrionaceae bacterium]